MQDALTSRFGEGKWIVGTWESGFYFNQDLIHEKKLHPSEIEDEAAYAVQSLPYVEAVYTRTQLMQRTSMVSTVNDYVARSFSRSAALISLSSPSRTGSLARRERRTARHGITTRTSR